MSLHIPSTKSNLIYIQPYYPLADKIISHRITIDQLQQLLDLYGGIDKFAQDVLTHYHYHDMVLEVNSAKQKACYITYVNDHTVGSHYELVMANRVDLSVTRFPLTKNYHHARQSVVLSRHGNGYRLDIEILLPNIKDPQERYSELPSILDWKDDDNDDVECPYISLSFKYIVKNRTQFMKYWEHGDIQKVLCNK